MSQTIALDAMGGDHGASVVTAAALRILNKNNKLRLILVGDQELLSSELSKHGASVGETLSIQHASQSVEMDEAPSLALRNKKDSSMRIAINLVKNGTADACVSAGNTGALMATARYVLKTLPGIDRPAICSILPSLHGHTHMLDLGANVGSSSQHLFQFAVMGSTLVSAIEQIEHPSVGLLNIGEEDMKGDATVKETARILSESNLNYIGFVEGNDIYTGNVDIVVCDGFVGNVALKASEGLAKMIGHFIKQEFFKTPRTKLGGMIARPALQAIKKRFDPAEYNGASFLGLQGIVVKSHGGADELSFSNAIKTAMMEVDNNVAVRISDQLEKILMERHAV
ncbi:MAG TPA: phosphate acyltransferase PlsX [Gammaproteobacteria bacterium]|nr:phosphate acyltransferase PlsX [Gammaproteobacteria bacterium]